MDHASRPTVEKVAAMYKPIAVVALLLATTVIITTAQPLDRSSFGFAPNGTPTELGLAGYAKVLCSAVFVSGREAAEAFRNSGFFMMADEQRTGITYEVDHERKSVRMTR